MRKLIIFLIALFMLGCQTQQSNTISFVDIHKGTDGLDMNFLPNAPPKEVYSNEDFIAGVQLENKGAFDIGDSEGYLSLVIEDDYMEFINPEDKEKRTFKLEGKSSFNPKGNLKTVTVKLRAKDVDTQSETHTSLVTVSACYKYKTTLGTEACVDADVYDLTQKIKACNTQDQTFSGQGAPVTITKIETRMLPHEDENKVKPSFMIYIKNKGNGEVVKGDSVEKACSSETLSHEAFNTIYANAKLSNQPLDCSPKEIQGSETKEGYIRLKDKEDFIRCTLTDGILKNKGTYITPLTIDLDYGYTLSASKEVKILKELNY
jgi:hypothetical protein